MKKKQHQKSKTRLMTLNPGMPLTSGSLVRDVRALIEHARGYVARSIDTTLAALYWQVGKRIQTEILKGKRADYGDKIVQTLSAQLLPDYGRGFGKRNLWSMVRFIESFPDVKIVQTLSAQLTWSHFVDLIYIKDDLKRNFYAEMCHLEKSWRRNCTKPSSWLVRGSKNEAIKLGRLATKCRDSLAKGV